jgi:hypothetical protein
MQYRNKLYLKGEIKMNMKIKEELEKQLKDINKRLDNVDDFKEWAILQVAKSNVLASLMRNPF